METIDKKNWKEKEDKIINKDDFLNDMLFKEASDVQQMLYLVYKKIEELELRISKLEAKKLE